MNKEHPGKKGDKCVAEITRLSSLQDRVLIELTRALNTYPIVVIPAVGPSDVQLLVVALDLGDSRVCPVAIVQDSADIHETIKRVLLPENTLTFVGQDRVRELVRCMGELKTDE